MSTLEPEHLACDAVLQWTVQTLGDRPIDHLVRDNLVGSMLRDPRAKRLQAHWRSPPDWMLEAVAHLPPRKRAQALQLACLQYLHQLQHARLATSIEDECETCTLADEGVQNEIYAALARIRQCPPVGALFEPAHGSKAEAARPCKRASLCPWCHGRRVADLYRRLAPRLQAATIGHPERWLLQARVEVDQGLFLRDGLEYWSWHVRRRRLSWPDHILDETDFACFASMRYCLEELQPQLRDIAGLYGARGGLLTYQLGPSRNADGYLSFSHRMGLLAEVEFNTPEARQRFLERTFAPTSRMNVMGFPETVEWLAMPASAPETLRFLLAGSSASYPVESLKLTGAWDRLPNGIPGVLSLQPMYLMDDCRALAVLQATKHQHLYEAFGTWKAWLSAGNKKPRTEQWLADLEQRQQQADRSRRLRSANEARRQEAATRRQEPLEAARDLWPKVKAEAQGVRGRPPHRKLLGKMLQGQGYACSDRDLRYLVKRLQHEPCQAA